jgi:histidine triad (HIT) family protein
MSDIFCKIIAGEIPSTKVYEDDDVFAILDISQTTRGHTLGHAEKALR